VCRVVDHRGNGCVSRWHAPTAAKRLALAAGGSGAPATGGATGKSHIHSTVTSTRGIASVVASAVGGNGTQDRHSRSSMSPPTTGTRVLRPSTASVSSSHDENGRLRCTGCSRWTLHTALHALRSDCVETLRTGTGSSVAFSDKCNGVSPSASRLRRQRASAWIINSIQIQGSLSNWARDARLCDSERHVCVYIVVSDDASGPNDWTNQT
jgi:hypothetical protein